MLTAISVKKTMLQNSLLALFTTSTLALSACGIKITTPTEKIQQTNSASGTSSLPVNVNKYASSKITCDPLNGGTTTQTNWEKGIKADLFYRTSSMPRMYKSTDYIQFTQKAEQSIFLSDMNVPTRLFTEGFATASGSYLKNDNNEKLIEYFGLKMTTNLILDTGDAEGDYELALLSDDGSVLTLKSGTSVEADEILIENDGDHPTRMGCSTRTIRMRRNVMQPIEVTYYQGPRTHISNVLLWRKSTTAGTDSLCNQVGNELFFDYTNNSAPQQAYQDLMARGWQVVKPNNFMISSTKTDYNPCVAGTKPVISQFEIGEVILTSASVSWSTDIPATSQVQLTNLTTGEVTTTTSDNVLRTDNLIQLTHLQPRTSYKIQAISVSEDLGRSISQELTLTTQ